MSRRRRSDEELLELIGRTPTEAVRRELHRAQARRSLLAQATYHDPAYVADRFHRDLAAHLDRVIDGSLRRVIIQAPPQHGKSRLASVELPAAWLGRHPDQPVIATSYGADLAYRHSREVQRVVGLDAWREVYGELRISRRHGAVKDWGLEGHRGGLVAAGVGGPITGRGAQLGIIDDPFKNWRDAQSLNLREQVWDWYRSTFLTRVWEQGRIVVIATRWHPDDLIGRLLEAEPGEWVVLNYPAVAEADPGGTLKGWRPDTLDRAAGEPLAPNRFSLDFLERQRVKLGPVMWAALYQQRPYLVEGGVIPVGKVEVLDREPDDLVRRVRFWDLAATPEGAAPDPDFTAGVLMGLRTSGRVVLLDVIHGRWSPATIETTVRRAAEVDGQSVSVGIEQEPGSAGVHVVSDYAVRLAGWHVVGERATGPQLTRVLPWAAQVDAGNVAAVRGPWLRGFLEEARAYRGDGSTHDDQVVAAAGAYRMLVGPVGAVAQPAAAVETHPDVEVVEWDSDL